MANKDIRLVEELELRGEGSRNAEVVFEDAGSVTEDVSAQAETLPLAPDPVVPDNDLTVDDLDGNEEGYRAVHPLNTGNIDNVIKGPGFVFVATGIYRDFYDLDRIYLAEPGRVVPRDLYLIADRDLLPEPARSRALGRKVRPLSDAGFIPSVGVPSVESVPGARRVDGNPAPSQAENSVHHLLGDESNEETR